MLENCKTIKERWGGVSKILDNWLQQRQELIVEFCSLSGVTGVGSEESSTRCSVDNLRRFCELMVDYVSAGHFEVYDHLIQEAEELKDGKGMEVARRLYPHISRTTELVLTFNDKYDLSDDQNSLPNLAADLSKLGETIVSRFELEDQLIENLHYAHEALVASA